ncbi:MAG: SpaH/EbpB family LPXTG-anchored major pilin [Dermatophilaceae bacterium]
MRTSPLRVAAALFSAAVLTFAGAATAVAAPAAQAPTGLSAAGEFNTANPALIDPSETGTLHITKYSGAPVGGYDNGLPKSVTGVTPLPGVTYEIYPVTGVDLLTNAGWKTAANYYDNITLAEANLGDMAGTCTTTATGTCDLTDLPLGLYYVKEVSAPAGYTMAAPFLVTLPMTNPAGPDRDLATTTDNNTTWMYDVYVYPKNQQDTITKTVEDKGTVTTDPTTTNASDHVIDYTLETTVTDGTAPLGMYVIYDDLDPSLTFTGVSLKINTTTLVRCTAVNTPAGCDYTVYTASDWGVNATAWDGTAVTGGPVVTIVLSDAGLTRIRE